VIVTIVGIICVNYSSHTLLLYTIRCGDQFDSRQGQERFLFSLTSWELRRCRGEGGRVPRT